MKSFAVSPATLCPVASWTTTSTETSRVVTRIAGPAVCAPHRAAIPHSTPPAPRISLPRRVVNMHIPGRPPCLQSASILRPQHADRSSTRLPVTGASRAWSGCGTSPAATPSRSFHQILSGLQHPRRAIPLPSSYPRRNTAQSRTTSMRFTIGRAGLRTATATSQIYEAFVRQRFQAVSRSRGAVVILRIDA